MYEKSVTNFCYPLVNFGTLEGPLWPKFTNLGTDIQPRPVYECAKFCPILTTCIRDICWQTSLISLTAWHTHIDKPVGFYGRIAPQFWTLQFGMPLSFDCWTPPHRQFNQNIPPSVVLLQQCHCRNRHRGKLQNLSPPSVLFESSQIFFTIHRTLKFEFCDFWEFFEIFKKVSRGPSAANVDIMVAAKLDQSRVLVTMFRQNR